MLFHINYSHFDCIPRAAQRIHFSGKAQSMSSVDIFENSPSGFMKRSGVTAQMAIYETDVKIIGAFGLRACNVRDFAYRRGKNAEEKINNSLSLLFRAGTYAFSRLHPN